MLRLILTFLILAIIAAIFGFGGIAGVAVHFAVILFWIFIALFVVSLLVRLASGGRAVGPTDF